MSMRSMRTSVFETNSSAMHAFVHLDEVAFEEWMEHGAYIDMRDAAEDGYLWYMDSDPSEGLSSTDYTDISGKMIGHAEIGSVRESLFQESYYRHPDDCLLEAGILPRQAFRLDEDGRTVPSAEWAGRCGGLNYIDVRECYDGGCDVIAEWYAW